VRFDFVQRLQAPLPVVEAAFVDPEFLQQLAASPRLGRVELLDSTDDSDHVQQRIRYSFAGDLSPAVKAVVDPARLTWVEDSTLDRGSHITTFTILPDNYARLLDASGSIRLEPDDHGGTVRRVEGNLSVHVPLVGRKVEAAIVSGLQENAEVEATVLNRWVRDRQ
jgi:hypothetical protein